MDAIHVPLPSRHKWIEGEQPFFGQRRNELNGEEWIAARLFLHQLRKRRGALRLAVKSVRDQTSEMLSGERRKRDLSDLSAVCFDRRQLPRQRMGGVDLVVAIGSDQQQVPQVRLGQQILEQVEGGRVEPLKIVEEQRQRMLRAGEYADKPTKHQLETQLRVSWRKFRDRRLLADDEFQFGNKVGHEPTVSPERLQKRRTPTGELGVALAEKGSHKALKSLHQRRVGNVALQLVELA